MLEDPNRKRCYLYEMISKGSLRKHFLTKKLIFKLGNYIPEDPAFSTGVAHFF